MVSPMPRPGVHAGRRVVGLTEALEDVGQQLAPDAAAGVAHRHHQHRGRCARARRRRGRRGPVNLIAFESRFHATCCRRSASPRIVAWLRMAAVTSMPRDCASIRTDRRLRSTTSAIEVGATLQMQLAGDDARDVEQIADQLRLNLRVALDHLHRSRHRRRIEQAGAQHPRPAVDGVERRAQLVGQRRQELVLASVGLLQRGGALLDALLEILVGAAQLLLRALARLISCCSASLAPRQRLRLAEQLDEDGDLRPQDVGVDRLGQIVDGAGAVAARRRRARRAGAR